MLQNWKQSSAAVLIIRKVRVKITILARNKKLTF